MNTRHKTDISVRMQCLSCACLSFCHSCYATWSMHLNFIAFREIGSSCGVNYNLIKRYEISSQLVSVTQFVHVGAGIHVNKIVTLKRKASRGSRTLDRYIALHYITLLYITLQYITLHYFTLHYFTLHYIILHRVNSQKTITGITPAMKIWEIKVGKSVASAQCLIFIWFNLFIGLCRCHAPRSTEWQDCKWTGKNVEWKQ
jgi:hypothetical protein